MKKILFCLLLLLASCNSKNMKPENLIIHDLDTDFPTTDTIVLSPIQTFTILPRVLSISVKDTVLFVYEDRKENLGHCYSINSGTEISTLLGIGKAANEFNPIGFVDIRLVGDSIEFADLCTQIIKTFATNDVVNKLIGERKFSKSMLPDSITSTQFMKINNNLIICRNSISSNNSDLGYFIYDGKGISLFGKIEKGYFNSSREVTNQELKNAWMPVFASYGDKVIAASDHGIILQVIDANKKTIDFERCYEQIYCEVEGDGTCRRQYKLNTYGTNSIYCTDKNIFCTVRKQNKEKSKEAGKITYDNFTLMFDWELNPIKKYYFKTEGRGIGRLSQDGKTYYHLTLNEEKQVLFMGKIE